MTIPDWVGYYVKNYGWIACEANEIIGNGNHMEFAVLHEPHAYSPNYYVETTSFCYNKTIAELNSSQDFTIKWVFRKNHVKPVYKGKQHVKVKAEPLPLP